MAFSVGKGKRMNTHLAPSTGQATLLAFHVPCLFLSSQNIPEEAERSWVTTQG
jgi:hypothetical protein